MNPSFQSHGVLLLILFLLSSYSATFALRLVPKQGEEERKMNQITLRVPRFEIEEDEPINLMGMEECGNGDEECLKRRIASEAHLDYIYTQQHRP